jgi:hypothetical protein
MRVNNWMVVSALCTGLSVGSASAQDKPAPPMSAEEKAAMEKWMAAATPGAPHKSIASMAGTWTAKVSSWMKPGDPPMVSEGTSEQKMILDGRFLEQRFTGSIMGQPFHGLGHSGYDNFKKKYVSTWMDTMGTMVLVMEGTADGTGKVVTYTGTMDDVTTGKPAKIKSVMTVIDPDHHQFEMWGPDPTGKVYKTMEIHYHRKK